MKEVDYHSHPKGIQAIPELTLPRALQGRGWFLFSFLLLSPVDSQSEEVGGAVETLLTCSSTLLIIFSCLDGDGAAGISPWKITCIFSLSFLGKWPPGC